MNTPRYQVRVGEIELFRFLFSIAVIMCHAREAFGNMDEILLRGGALAVEFFFIVSGYLLAVSTEKLETIPPPRTLAGKLSAT